MSNSVMVQVEACCYLAPQDASTSKRLLDSFADSASLLHYASPKKLLLEGGLDVEGPKAADAEKV